ncbi:MAG TPA: ribosome-associated translation inhibitor RaiA [Saprospiraceae bacterium]|nr:ribosome-associated translation inhibitor RaiA [Saprospiraceae bacterium]
MKTHTEAVHFTADQKLLVYIEKKLLKLQQFFDNIIDANVILKLENVGQVKDKVAEIKIHLPGSTIFAKESNRSFEVAVDDAVESLRKQLIKYKERKHID